jgi:hypothetical protein
LRAQYHKSKKKRKPKTSAFYFMAAAVAHFIAVKVPGIDMPVRSLAGPRHRSLVAVIGMEMVIDVSVEVLVSMKPRPDTDEYSVVKPFRSIVPIGGAGVRRNVVIAVRAKGCYPDPNAHLSLCRWSGSG